MNRPRYAPITSGLLVRKGEAKPWKMPGHEEFAHVPENMVPVNAEHEFTEEEIQSGTDYQNWKRTRDAEVAANPVPERRSAPVRREHQPLPLHNDGDDHSKRLTLRLTPSEYERLGIIGVKRDMTRQQLLRHAIDYYLAQAKHEFQAACGCLAGEGCHGDC